MEFLSWLFFCLSPFALFCSENGNGLVLFPVFIILGFICRWVGNNIGGTSTPVIKIEPQKFWEWHYKDRIRSALAQKDSIGDYLMSAKDKEARSWATTICGYHNAPVPSECVQEQIARANGVVTEKIVKEREIKKDRIQIGKYFLMNELQLKYENGNMSVERKIREDIKKIKILHHGGADDWYVKREYGKTVREMWETLSLEEKEQAEKWVEEYESKLIRAIQDYENHRELTVRPIEMDF